MMTYETIATTVVGKRTLKIEIQTDQDTNDVSYVVTEGEKVHADEGELIDTLEHFSDLLKDVIEQQHAEGG